MPVSKKVLGLLFILLLLVLWQLSYINQNVNFAVIPPPSKIIEAFITGLSSGVLVTNAIASLSRVILGFIFAAAVGIGLGLLLGYYTSLKPLIEPIIELLRPIPPIAWIPIAIIIFGLGNTPAYFIVFIGAFFPIYLNTSFGVLQMPNKYKNLSKTLGLSDFRYFKDVLFKFSLPYIFTGLRIGMGMAWMSVIASEMISAQSGLGYYILLNQITLNTSNVLAGMLLIGLLGYILTGVITLSEKRLVPWKGV